MQTSGKSCRENAKARPCHIINCHRAIQYSRDGSERFERPRRTGSPGPGYANRLRPKADFGGQEASPQLRRTGSPKL